MTENDQISEIVFFLTAAVYALLGAGGALVMYQAATKKAKLSWRLSLDNWQRPALCLAFVFELVCLLYSFYEPYTLERSHLHLRGQKVNLKIVHLSDAHFDDTDRGERQIVTAVQDIKPDLIVFTGDAANTKAGLLRFALFIKALSAIAPTFAVSGNHDRLSRQFFESNGARLIDGETVKLETDQAQINIVGLNLYRERRKDISARTQVEAERNNESAGASNSGSDNASNSPSSVVLNCASNQASDGVSSSTAKSPSANKDAQPMLLALSHYPACHKLAADLKADLFLCGHTHGGQVTLSPFRLFERGYYGGSPPSYVNRGLGMFGLPIRFLCPPELTIIELQKD
ncbi:MAG: metallophosphoesterase [Candidatus Melainabacteria bacterium]|nr:metallophosphoesterase [Candidatus Melainabacteria bacterium]